MKPAVAALAAFLVAGVVVHLALLWEAPRWATDRQIADSMRRGLRMNVLNYGKPPRAGSTRVPLANADMLAVRAYLDLSKGPRVIEGLRPQNCAYWSASVFAHDTDAVLVRSDLASPDRRISIGLRTAGQRLGEPVKDEAVLPSRTGVVLLRCFMRDRNDPAYVGRLMDEQHGLTMRPAQGAPA